jgi:hypothetical protein
MKKIYLIFSAVVFVMILLNVVYYLDLKKQQITFQKKYITEQGSTCVAKLENTGFELENDINSLLFSNDFSILNQPDADSEELHKKIEVLYAKYPKLISNISLYDQNKFVFSLYRDKKEIFIVDKYSTHSQQTLYKTDTLIFENNAHNYIFPVFKNKTLHSNLILTLDYVSYLEYNFQNYVI